jgi:hypothetical protein
LGSGGASLVAKWASDAAVAEERFGPGWLNVMKRGKRKHIQMLLARGVFCGWLRVDLIVIIDRSIEGIEEASSRSSDDGEHLEGSVC